MQKIAVLGASGRMGRTLVALLEASGDQVLSGQWDRELQGSNIAEAIAGADVVIDFTAPGAISEIVETVANEGCALVSGTTGLGEPQMTQLQNLAKSVPVLWDRNMSIGVQLITELARKAAVVLKDTYDIEIAETHHSHKLDAPSGTALKLGEAVAESLGAPLSDIAQYARHGADAKRKPGEIGFSVRRGGNVIGEHSVSFFGAHDVIEIRHSATDRRLFAAGALKAASWLGTQSAGFYSVADILALD